MKKSLALILVFAIIIGVAGCGNSGGGGGEQTETEKDTYSVKFMLDGRLYRTVDGEEEDTFDFPAVPNRSGCDFAGWFFDDGEWEEQFDAEYIGKGNLKGDLTVHAKYEEWLEHGALPKVYIDTSGAPILNKEDYVTSTISITGAGKHNVEPRGAGIRLRGNSTLHYPKKPYRIKFDKSIGLFGEPSNKSWVLLADFNDPSSIKNYGAYSLAEKISPDYFTPMAVHVEVYLNGTYQGVYLFSDQVQENSGRLGIENDLEDGMTVVPFFIELDHYGQDEGTLGKNLFKLKDGNGYDDRYFLIKFPDVVDHGLTTEQFNYIKNYVTTVDTLIRNNGNYEDYIDVDSFIDYYLVQEFFLQHEINWKSINMSKSAGGLLKMGPVWDFDWACGGPISYFKDGAGQTTYNDWLSTGNWFRALLSSGRFTEKLKAKWAVYAPVFSAHITKLSGYKTHIAAAGLRNQEKWQESIWSHYGFTTSQSKARTTFDYQYANTLSLLSTRFTNMNNWINAL